MSSRLYIYALVVILVAGAAGAYLLSRNDKAQAAVEPSFITLGTHPEAAAQPWSSSGGSIGDMIIKDGKVYMGYGDYGVNTGPIHINPFDIASGSFDGSQLEIPTEQIGVFRDIGGDLYAPMLDPRLSFTQDVGYAKQGSDGSWSNVFAAPAVHIFDMATLDGNDLWMVGSSVESDGVTERGATAYRSTDGGATWNIVMTDMTTPYEDYSGYERYYWIAELNGRIYMQANRVENAPMRSFDGTNWYEGTTDEVCRSARSGSVVVFADNIICWAPNGVVRAFDGTNYRDIELTVPVNDVEDFYINDGYLYVLASRGGLMKKIIMRTSDLESWERVGSIPGQATTFAIDDDYIYLGTNGSQLLRSSATITEFLEAESSYEDCFAFDAGSGLITGYYDHEGDLESNPSCSKNAVIPSTIKGVSVTGIGDFAFYARDIETVVIPDSVETIGDAAFSGNNLTSATLSDSVVAIGREAFSNNKLVSISIPNSVETIGDAAFSENQLASVAIPDSVTSIGFGAFSYNSIASLTIGTGLTEIGANTFSINRIEAVSLPSSVTSVDPSAFMGQGIDMEDIDMSDIYYTRLYTDNVSITSQALSDGEYVYGGYIVNPARLVVRYENPTGQEIAPNQVFAGIVDGDFINDYLAVNGPAIVDPSDMTPLAAYFSSGDEAIIEAPDVSGYLTPSAQTFALVTGDNNRAFVYQVDPDSVTGDDDENQSSTGSSSSSTGNPDGLADTGENTPLVAAAAGLLILTGLAAVIFSLRYKRA